MKGLTPEHLIFPVSPKGGLMILRIFFQRYAVCRFPGYRFYLFLHRVSKEGNPILCFGERTKSVMPDQLGKIGQVFQSVLQEQ